MLNRLDGIHHMWCRGRCTYAIPCPRSKDTSRWTQIPPGCVDDRSGFSACLEWRISSIYQSSSDRLLVSLLGWSKRVFNFRLVSRIRCREMDCKPWCWPWCWRRGWRFWIGSLGWPSCQTVCRLSERPAGHCLLGNHLTTCSEDLQRHLQC